MALLQDDFWPAMFHDNPGCETSVDDIPSRSAHIASCFLELERLNQELRSKLRGDFTNILNGMDNISLSSTSQLPSPVPTPPSHSSSLIHDTSFITEAYAWLLDNIANPYPSSMVKASLTQRYNCPLSAVNSWFINARRRMGWTALCRDRFHNCRADALDAAHRALVKEDPNRQLAPDIVHAFVSVKVAAEELYSAILNTSTLSSDLEIVLQDMSGQSSIPANQQQRCASKGIIGFSKESDNQKLVAHCYPSCDHSPSSSQVPTLGETPTDRSEEVEKISPPSLTRRKRRFSATEAACAPTSESTGRLVKRPRPNSSFANVCLPSPVTSAEESLECDQTLHSVLTTQNSKSRKRRLSDASNAPSPKRLRDSMTGPRPCVVSNPLPLSTESEASIDEWLKSNLDSLFSLPPPVDVLEPDLSTQWEVELFNKYILPEELQRPVTPPIQDNQAPSSADLTTLDTLLQSLESGGFVAPSEIMRSSAMVPVPDPISQSLPLPLDLSQIIDWAGLFNEGPSELVADSTFPQCCTGPVLPEIDLSILQLPLVWTTVAS